jgi:hypothetical protein
MSRLSSRSGGVVRLTCMTMAAAALLGGCEKFAGTPQEPEVAIPFVDVDGPDRQEAACGSWSCSWQDCQQDPGVYGACCTRAAEQGETVMPKPSCGGQPYCVQFPSVCGPTEYHPASYCQGRAGQQALWDCDNYCSAGTGIPSSQYCCWQSGNVNYPNCELNL